MRNFLLGTALGFYLGATLTLTALGAAGRVKGSTALGPGWIAAAVFGLVLLITSIVLSSIHFARRD